MKKIVLCSLFLILGVGMSLAQTNSTDKSSSEQRKLLEAQEGAKNSRLPNWP